MLILLGLRCSGKSTIGPLLAARLSFPPAAFADLDVLTAARLAVPSAAHAITTLGLPAFRQAEAAALTDLLASPGPIRILALGGGTPTAPGAADLLRTARDRHAAFLVYLRNQPATLAARLAATNLASRPALTSAGNPLAEVAHLFTERDGLYQSLANLTLEADHLAPAAAVDQILSALPKPLQ
jgi:shikimate kinase